MPAKAKPKVVRKRKPRSGGKSNQSSQGRAFTTQPPLLGNQIRVGKIPLFPPRYRGSLRYADTITLSSTSGAVASWVISANGLYDPDVTGTGHQPAGFDQMMLSYEHYVVTHAMITATFHNNTSTVAPTVAVSVNAGSTPVTIINQIMEDGLVSTSRLSPFGVDGSFQTIRRSINIAKFGGVSNILDDPNYRGTVAANPAEQSYFILQLWNTENGTSSSSCDFVVEFISWFTEPRKLTESLIRSTHLALRVETEEKEDRRSFRGPGETRLEKRMNQIMSATWSSDLPRVGEPLPTLPAIERLGLASTEASNMQPPCSNAVSGFDTSTKCKCCKWEHVSLDSSK